MLLIKIGLCEASFEKAVLGDGGLFGSPQGRGISCRGRKTWACRGEPKFEQYGVALVKSRDIKKPGDWNCFRCGNINFKIREECNKCQLAKEEATSDTFRFDIS